MPSYLEEVFQQPASLRLLARTYQQNEPSLLSAIQPPQSLVLSGMGASLHAALAMTCYLHWLGFQAFVLEASDLLHYGLPLLTGGKELLYVSQSGASAEVIPLLAQAPADVLRIAVTNDPESPLAANARHVLPLLAGVEETVATKTFVNSLAALWLLARRWSGKSGEADYRMLEGIAGKMENLLEHAQEIAAQWLDRLGRSETIIFTGAGPHAATARQAAQTVTEWSKFPALGMSAGALRHGYVEIAGPQAGIVVFSAPGPTQEIMLRLAVELQSYGAKVLIVENGSARKPGEPASSALEWDEFLSPLLDILPVQLFTEALRQDRGVAPGFQHLTKVISRL